jgi:hypothetical protein
MTTAVQRRRGTTTEHSSFTGLEGEISVNTTKDTLVVHDGSTVGGFELARADGSNFVASTVDINGGSIDGTTIGSSSASTGAFTTLSASGEITANGGIALGDNDKATFGDGDDLQIYHDTHSYIQDTGAGNLFLLTQGAEISLLGNTSSEYMGRFIQDGSVELYHNGFLKIATTATGIDVTGTATMDGLSLDNAQYINFKNSSNVLTRSLGINGANTFYIGGIDADIGDILFVDGGTTRASFANGGDISFYEDTGTTAKLFWDASAESLGIGTSSPDTQLTLYKASTNADVNYAKIRMDSWGGSTGKLKSIVWDDAGSSVAGIGAEYDGAKTNIHFHSQYNGGFKGTADRTMSIMGDGNVGIGTSSPLSRLNAKGTQGNWRVDPDSVSGEIQVFSTTTANDGFRDFRIRTQQTIFDTAGTERMRIDSSGNVGIGVVPSAWRSGAKAFQSGGNGLVTLWEQANGSTNLGFGVYESASNVFNYTTTGDTPTLYSQITGVHKWYNAPSGTAGNAITWQERMRIDSSGNLLVGHTSAEGDSSGTTLYQNGQTVHKADGSYALELVRSTSDGEIVRFRKDGTTVGSIGSNATGGTPVFDISANSSSGIMRMLTSGSERMRIDSSGNLLVGTPSARTGTNSLTFEPSNSFFMMRAAGTGTLSQVAFVRDTAGTPAQVGDIATTGTATSYNTSSDQRLKENIADADDAGSKIDAIQVRQYDWKADGSHQDYGMVAQELLEVAPEAVSVPEDSEQMMGVDYSKLVPMLIKEIQSLRNRVAQLEGI